MVTARKYILSSLIFLTFIGVYSFFTSKAIAVEETGHSWAIYPPENFADSLDKTFPEDGKPGEIEAKSYVLFTENSRFYGWSCMIGVINCSNNTIRQQSFFRGSALGITSQLIASTYGHPPASFGYYLADLGTKLGVPPSYAQGLGFGGLRPIISLWKGFRNAAYILLTAVLITIGFMVMFRMKIDPRTVITIQAALPRIVITLLLITFSYAIAGFLIDLMYLAILISISVIYHSMPEIFKPDTLSSTQAWYLTGGVNVLFSQTFGVMPPEGWDQLKWWLGGATVGLGLLATPIPKIIALLPGFGITAFLSKGLGFLLLTGIIGGSINGLLHSGTVIGGAFNPLVLIIAALGLLFMVVRLFFLLLNAYVQILISVIFAPIQLLFDALPTTTGNFSRWIRNLIANLAVFPTVIILLMIGRAIATSLASVEGPDSPLWTPPLVPAWSKDAAQFVIGFGVITLIPNLVGALKNLLKAKPIMPVGIGAPMAPFISGMQTGLGVAQQFYYGRIALKSLRGLVQKGEQQE